MSHAPGGREREREGRGWDGMNGMDEMDGMDGWIARSLISSIVKNLGLILCFSIFCLNSNNNSFSLGSYLLPSFSSKTFPSRWSRYYLKLHLKLHSEVEPASLHFRSGMKTVPSRTSMRPHFLQTNSPFSGSVFETKV